MKLVLATVLCMVVLSDAISLGDLMHKYPGVKRGGKGPKHDKSPKGPKHDKGPGDFDKCPLFECVHQAETEFIKEAFGGNGPFSRSMASGKRSMFSGMDAKKFFSRSAPLARREMSSDDAYTSCQKFGAQATTCLKEVFTNGSVCDCPPMGIVMHMGHELLPDVTDQDMINMHCDFLVYQRPHKGNKPEPSCQDATVLACVENGIDMIETLMDGDSLTADQWSSFDQCGTAIQGGADTTGCTWAKFAFGTHIHEHIRAFFTAVEDGCDVERLEKKCWPEDMPGEDGPCSVNAGEVFDSVAQCISEEDNCGALLTNQATDRVEFVDWVDNTLCPTTQNIESQLTTCGVDVDKLKDNVEEMLEHIAHHGPPMHSEGSEKSWSGF